MYSRSRRLHNQLSRARSALNRPRLTLEEGALQAEAKHLIEPVDPAVRHAYGLIVQQTYAVAGPPGTGISHYTITLVPDGLGETVQLVVVTRDLARYTLAVDAEGNRRRTFDVTYHPSKRPDGLYCQWLDQLEERATDSR